MNYHLFQRRPWSRRRRCCGRGRRGFHRPQRYRPGKTHRHQDVRLTLRPQLGPGWNTSTFFQSAYHRPTGEQRGEGALFPGAEIHPPPILSLSKMFTKESPCFEKLSASLFELVTKLGWNRNTQSGCPLWSTATPLLRKRKNSNLSSK